MSVTGKTEAGFTLLEMLVVLAATALVAGLGWPMAERAIAGAQFRTVAAEAEARLIETRARAISGGAPATFAPPREPGTARWSLPRGGIVFHPDGSASGGEVALALEGRSARFAIDSATGAVRKIP
jgi:general secretion pathway protein H